MIFSVQTEETLKRFDYTKQTFTYNNISTFLWGDDAEGSHIFDSHTPLDHAQHMLSRVDDTRLRQYFDIAVRYRVESHVFIIFSIFLSRDEISLEDLSAFMDAYPSLVYCILKKFISDTTTSLPESLAPIIPCILQNVVRSANELGIAALAALERLESDINKLDLKTFFNLMWLAGVSVRSQNLVQEVLLVLYEASAHRRERDPFLAFSYQHALGIIFDRVDEAADTCPCDDFGRIKRQRARTDRAKLVSPQPQAHEETGGAEVVAPEENISSGTIAVAHTRIDNPTPIRIHSHVRLKLASIDEHSTLAPAVLDAVVIRAMRGELHLKVQQPLPPEWRDVDWNIFDAGGTATSAAMLAAVLKLAQKRRECCRIDHILVGLDPVASGAAPPAAHTEDESEGESDEPLELEDTASGLNTSQLHAVRLAIQSHLCLIWGPPG